MGHVFECLVENESWRGGIQPDSGRVTLSDAMALWAGAPLADQGTFIHKAGEKPEMYDFSYITSREQAKCMTIAFSPCHAGFHGLDGFDGFAGFHGLDGFAGFDGRVCLQGRVQPRMALMALMAEYAYRGE